MKKINENKQNPKSKAMRWSFDGAVEWPKWPKYLTDTFSRQHATFFNQQHLLTFCFLLKYLSLGCTTNALDWHYTDYFV